MAPANTFKKTDPGTAKVCNRAFNIDVALWDFKPQTRTPPNLFEKIG